MKTSIGPLATEPTTDFTTAALSGSFSGGVLTVIGDNLDNNTVVSRNAAGQLLVNGGAVPIAGGTPTVANTSLIQVFGLGGNDVLSLNEANGALPRANLFGGAGNDVLTGGSGADLLFGQADNDTLLGKGGNDFLFGGNGNDVLTGGDADDQMFGEAGDDRFIWNPGDDTDLVEGGTGIDTVEVNGGNGAETFTITPNGTRVRFDRVDPAPFSIDAGTVERFVVHANGGDDVVTGANGLGALVQLTIDGGTGNDRITGGDGADLLLGGDGNDLVTGGRGNDTALLGTGDDSFVWNPGDGSDVVEGQAGIDTMDFNGANVAEAIDIAANGGRVRFFRNIANVTMDLNDVERIHFDAFGGADQIAVGDLSGTDVETVEIALGAAGGGGDGAVDVTTLQATQGSDSIDVSGAGGTVSVDGLSARVLLSGSEAQDRLVLQTGAGNDTIDAAALAAGNASLTIESGAGNDRIVGSQGADLIVAGDGNDVVVGARGDDVALLGAGDDAFVWNPGDGSDVVEGGDGNDALIFNGANASENIDLSANGGRARFFRDVATVTMDLNGVERVHFAALGGADTIAVGDLSGTSVAQVELDLGLPGQGGDGQVDTVSVNGSAGNDSVKVTGAIGGEVIVTGLAAEVSLTSAESIDRLQVSGGIGDDTIDASGVAAGRIGLALNGGAGTDLLIGSAGADLVNGGSGNDVALMGAGDDTFVWNPGDGSDVVEGQAGSDTMLFNGANVSETVDISANGGRAVLFRNIANITMDMNDVEAIRFNALGGADQVTIGDLSGTDVGRIEIGLGALPGSDVGDGAADTVTINGTNGADNIVLSLVDGDLVVDGLASKIVIDGFEAGDTLQILGLGGDDVIDASAIEGLAPRLVMAGGAGDDVLIGGAGNDVLVGNDGDDVLLGQAGDDVLDGGAGDDVLIGGTGTDVLLNGEVVLQIAPPQVAALIA